MYKVSIMASGGGGNFRAILEHGAVTQDYAVICLVTNHDCGAVSVAKEFGIPARLLSSNEPKNYLELIPEDTDLLVLAGFMPVVPSEVCDRYRGRFINTHPSLLPKFGGKGMYGVNVQNAVLAAGESEAGCTVHRVDSTVDGGEILAQDRFLIPIDIDAWSLGGLVFELEKNLLPKIISKFATGSL
jgi:phosphoribosylglycinamide formyltransferase-1